MYKKNIFSGNQLSIFYILLFGLFFRAIIAFWLFPGYDEGYYYLYTQNLDWSFFDHPLFVSLTTGFGIWFTGITSPFTLRIGTLLLYTGSLFLLYLISLRLFNQKTAKITLILASIIPIFQIGFGVITLPDSPLIFFWSASIYCATCELFPKKNINYRPTYRLSILGVLIGLTCLSKYHGFVLGFCLFTFCLSNRIYRRAVLSSWCLLGFASFVTVLFPLIFWNYQHDWVSLRFQLFDRFSSVPNVSKPYSILKIFNAFLTNIGLLFPTIGIPLWWVTIKTVFTEISTSINNKIRTEDEKYLSRKKLFILWMSLPLILGLNILGGKEQILATWPMPGFWSLILLLGFYVEKWQDNSKKTIEKWLKINIVLISCLLLLILAHINTGFLLQGSRYAILGGFLNTKTDPSTELINVNQLKEEVSDSPMLLEALQNSDFIFTNAYYLSGLIDLALRPLKSIPVTCFSYDRRGFTFWTNMNQLVGKDALYITLKRFHEMPGLTNEFRDFFKEMKEIGKVDMKRGGVTVETLYFYEAKSLLKPYKSSKYSIR